MRCLLQSNTAAVILTYTAAGYCKRIVGLLGIVTSTIVFVMDLDLLSGGFVFIEMRMALACVTAEITAQWHMYNYTV
jgi:hypothetical protein